MPNSFKNIPIKVVPATPADAPAELEEVVLYEKHKKVYPRWITGRFTQWRWFWVVATQLFFYGMPWLQWHDRQMLLFDLVNRKFYIFGFIFLPQDFIYLTALLLVSAFGLFVWTSIAGRLWCGYSCPQTVYTEIFLWIEKWVEGDRLARMKLDNGPMNLRRLRIKYTKHALWIALSLWTGFTFVGYFTPIHELGAKVASWSTGPWEAFWILFYGFATYGNAGWMREQVCKYMCPYARFQSAMFDPDTLVISYDAERGEPRGSRRKGEDHRAEGKGDCIDCKLCVQVCPVGIDIRDGLQYECIACGACIDACDSIMDKMNYPRGLVRYTTENALAHKYPESQIVNHVLRPRVVMYSAALLLVVVATVASLLLKSPIKVNVMRDRNALVRETDEGLLENSYRLQVQNTDEKPHRFVIRADGLPDLKVLTDQGDVIPVPANGTASVGVRVQVEPQHVSRGSKKIYFEVQAADDLTLSVREKSSFINR
ncbi:cytochrome c oxidase accessory protein CcoG [Chitinimonas koreensis]|uniref:cytochrome c oxidase accessory protein CcoG n=1 Tax=Chitinimonas koreensis TaxID=356302 RepID=UPI0003FDDD1B|nr:cytochrome c oxidase accessory protein CcoG [Chitinimonas koreensis]QNM98020.1 cytochrome c oxidase accessory protein CcoG [Chitinimonas koreensis]